MSPVKSRTATAVVIAATTISALAVIPAVSVNAATNPVVTNGVTATTTINTDWSSGYCADVAITTTATTPQTWSTPLPTDITINSLWNAKKSIDAGGSVVIKGAAWNPTVNAGTPTSFGYCATRAAVCSVTKSCGFSSAASRAQRKASSLFSR